MQAWMTTGQGSLVIGEVSEPDRRFHYADSEASVADDLATLVCLAATGRLQSELGLVADWHEAPQVITAMVERTVRGNTALTVTRKGTHDE